MPVLLHSHRWSSHKVLARLKGRGNSLRKYCGAPVCLLAEQFPSLLCCSISLVLSPKAPLWHQGQLWSLESHHTGQIQVWMRLPNVLSLMQYLLTWSPLLCKYTLKLFREKGPWYMTLTFNWFKKDFPGGALDRSLPANSRHTVSNPGPGRFYVLWGN